MLRFITAATALTVLVACDSEGIDRVTTVAGVAGPETGTVTVDNDTGTGIQASDADADEIP